MIVPPLLNLPNKLSIGIYLYNFSEKILDLICYLAVLCIFSLFHTMRYMNSEERHYCKWLNNSNSGIKTAKFALYQLRDNCK